MSAPGRDTPKPELWRVRFICCGRADGDYLCTSWEEADKTRNLYTSGPGVNPLGYSSNDTSGHQRAAIVELIARIELAEESS